MQLPGNDSIVVTYIPMNDLDRKSRAALRRRTASLKHASLGDIEQDPSPLFGLAAVSLVQQLTQECWALAGRETPGYSRGETPIRFVPERPRE
jgi:hypothetical protein